MMPLDISVNLEFELDQASTALLQFEAAVTDVQRPLNTHTHVSPGESLKRVSGEDAVGKRLWVQGEGRVEVLYTARVAIERPPVALEKLRSVFLPDIPSIATKHLLDSRYCHPAQFVDLAHCEFGAIENAGARVAAIREWVARHVAYTPGASDNATTAIDTFHSGVGTCRDFAHLVITLARAMGVPARYAACYAPGVTPQDFHAVAQVFLEDPTNPTGGAWHLVDATSMADPAQTAIIGVGRDAGDVSFITSFGPMRFVSCDVKVALADSLSQTVEIAAV